MGVNFAFSNDCDLMTWAGYVKVHDFLNELNLIAGDSFWLFDPSGGDMGLFTFDINHKGPYHNEILDEINAGHLDVMHSVGSYGERFNKGYKPNRAQVAYALEYLAQNAKVPKIWTNHGDVNNIQNIGGQFPQKHHKGDDKLSDVYILDLLIEHGVEYFWLDHNLWRDPSKPYRLLSEEMTRDGRKIKVFRRFLPESLQWSSNGQNFSELISTEVLEKLISIEQNTIFYTHWGCHHKDKFAYSPINDPLTDDSKSAIVRFADFIQKNNCTVVRLLALLKEEESKPYMTEVQRIGSVIVRPEHNKADTFWFNQYNKHSIPYFVDRVAKLGVKGCALDAGCGVGQWTIAMTKFCDEVYGIEINDTAYAYLQQLSSSIFSEFPKFEHGTIEDMPYLNNFFDWIVCYGVIFCTNVEKSLKEFNRVLKPNGKAYICLNGDGWYEYLCDDRFLSADLNTKKKFSLPLFNAFVMRIGGYIKLFESIDNNIILIENIDNASKLRECLLYSFDKVMPAYLKDYIANYSDNIITLLVLHIDDAFKFYKATDESKSIISHLKSKFFRTNIYDKMQIPQNLHMNRAFLPLEFKDFVTQYGFSLLNEGSDGILGNKKVSTRPIYKESFNGHVSVWECIIEKND